MKIIHFSFSCAFSYKTSNRRQSCSSTSLFPVPVLKQQKTILFWLWFIVFFKYFLLKLTREDSIFYLFSCFCQIISCLLTPIAQLYRTQHTFQKKPSQKCFQCQSDIFHQHCLAYLYNFAVLATEHQQFFSPCGHAEGHCEDSALPAFNAQGCCQQNNDLRSVPENLRLPWSCNLSKV